MKLLIATILFVLLVVDNIAGNYKYHLFQYYLYISGIHLSYDPYIHLSAYHMVNSIVYWPNYCPKFYDYSQDMVAFHTHKNIASNVFMFAGENPLASTQCLLRKLQDLTTYKYDYYNGVLITHYDVLCNADIFPDEDERVWSVYAGPLIREKYFKHVSKIIKGESVAVLKVSISIEIVNC